MRFCFTLRFWDDDLVDLELFQMDDWNHNSPWYFPVWPRFALILAEICYGNTKWMDFSMFSLQITGWSKGILQEKFLKIHERLVIWANYIEMAPWDKWYPVVTIGCSVWRCVHFVQPDFLGWFGWKFLKHMTLIVLKSCPKWEKQYKIYKSSPPRSLTVRPWKVTVSNLQPPFFRGHVNLRRCIGTLQSNIGRAEPLLGAAESFGHLRRLLKTRWRNWFVVANLEGFLKNSSQAMSCFGS